jgi:hypothetical protein
VTKHVLICRNMPTFVLLGVADKPDALHPERDKLLGEVAEHDRQYAEYEAAARDGVEAFAKQVYADLPDEKEKKLKLAVMTDYFYKFDGRHTTGLKLQFGLKDEHEPPVFKKPPRHRFAFSKPANFVIEEVPFTASE